MINWLRSYLRARKKRRYLERLRKQGVVFNHKFPASEYRNWSDQYMRSLKK